MSEYNKNVLMLMTGTTIAQAIPIALSPILTRLYSPEDFGMFALFLSVVSILAIMVTGRYEIAAMLPKRKQDALALVLLSILINICLSFLLLMAVIAFNRDIVEWFSSAMVSSWLYWIPVSVFLTGLYQSFYSYANREKAYKNMSVSRVMQNGTTGLVSLLVGITKLSSSGLIIGLIVGRLAAVMNFAGMIRKECLVSLNGKRMYLLAKRYQRFPKIDIWAALASVSSNHSIPLLMNALFSATITGYYFLIQRILAAPTVLISSAIKDVFKEIAIREYQQYGHAKKAFSKTFVKLLAIAIVPYALFFLYAEEVIVVIFGADWVIAGEYARALTPMLFLQFIVSPLSFMVYITEQQHYNVIGQMILLAGVIGSLFTGAWFGNPYISIVLISVCYSVFYFIFLGLSARMAKVI